ncbi:Carboxylesterase [Neopestalotiopsis sp. 37M]|nr:Carboxylesterase [Neopestalotiopsis sp. 37M]
MLEAETGDVCDDSIFLTDYAACLSCSGEDNLDIWKYYSPQLTSAAAACGLETTPLAGAQSTTVQSAIAAETGAAETTSAAASATEVATSSSAAATSAISSATAQETASGTAVATSTGNATSTAPTSVVTAGSWAQFVVNMPLLSAVLAISAVRALAGL